MTTRIQWTDETWNPTRGCSRVSPGCDNCYAIREARRHDHDGGSYEGLTTLRKDRYDWSGIVALPHENGGTLTQPLRWMGHRRIFVNSMSDLFHESLDDYVIDRIFGVMWACLHDRHGGTGHVFQVLTKRAERMRRYMTGKGLPERWAKAAVNVGGGIDPDGIYEQTLLRAEKGPHPRIHLGVSVEDQQRADERLPHLIQTPAAVRFISAEPLLGPLDISIYLYHGVIEAKPGDADYDALNWVIVGGESGPDARFYNLAWPRSIIKQCRIAGVPVFHKQIGSRAWDDTRAPCADNRVYTKHKKGGDPAEWPKELRIREWPA